MSNVKTMTITSVRDDIYGKTEHRGVTAITRGGRFVGVLITPGNMTDAMADQMHRMLNNNPQHTMGLLTRRAIR